MTTALTLTVRTSMSCDIASEFYFIGNITIHIRMLFYILYVYKFFIQFVFMVDQCCFIMSE